MNEDAQIKAIVAELRAQGFEVAQDVPATEIGDNWPDFTLDLVAWPPTSGSFKPAFVIEIANRRGRPDSEDVASDLDEERAVARFQSIGEAIRSSAPWVNFQVRFLDVSADQAFARTLVGTSVFNADSVTSQFEELKAALDQESLVGHSRSLVVAHEWARWLRITAYRWPARPREMPLADLRKIQKDLFDAGVITTSPSQYYRTHQSILAAIEGGDVEWDRVEALEGDLLTVASRVADYVVGMSDKPTAVPGARRKRPDELFDRIEKILDERFSERRRERLLVLLRGLRDADGTTRYTDALGKFVVAIGSDRSVLGNAYDGLLARAPQDPNLNTPE